MDTILSQDSQAEIPVRLWQSALRFALDADGAPTRCTRRVCRAEGLCHLLCAPGQRFDCGGGVPETVVERAAQHTLFALLVAPSLGIPDAQS